MRSASTGTRSSYRSSSSKRRNQEGRSVSAKMGTCSGCDMPKRLTPSGMVYTHRNILTNTECEGSRKPVKSIEAQLAEAREEVMEAVKAVQEADEPTRRKTG